MPKRSPEEQAAWAAIRERARIVKDTQAEVQAILREAVRRLQAVLLDAPTESERWLLPQMIAEIERVAGEAGRQAAQAAAAGQTAAWNAGVASVEGPVTVAAAAAQVAVVLPLVTTAPLQAMRQFTTSKIAGIALEAANRINTELGLTILGAQTPQGAMAKVSEIMGGIEAKRAARIVNTELARAYSVAAQQRATDATAAGVKLDKVWRSSGKLHPRPHHAHINGQRRRADEPFVLKGGALTMMYPHDPKAPVAEVVNCGCVAQYRPAGWTSQVKPLRGNIPGDPTPPIRELLGT